MGTVSKETIDNFQVKWENNAYEIDGLLNEDVEEIIIPCKLNGLPVKRVSSFEGNQSLKKVIIEEGVESFGDNVFAGCFNLASIVIPRSLKDVGKNSLSG